MLACIGLRIPAEKLYVERATPRCGHKIPEGSRFCPTCGLGVDIEEGPKKFITGFDGKTFHGFGVHQSGEYFYIAPIFASSKSVTGIHDMAAGEARTGLTQKLGSLWNEGIFGMWVFEETK